jgi:DNA-binding response OmpR family regulator
MPKTILVIDDDPDLLRMVDFVLAREGYHVITAASGEEGLKQAYAHHPDLIILDIMMPHMDGWQLCSRLRHISDTPIIILTAKTTKVDLQRGFALGADDYLTKPCDFGELKARLKARLRRSELSPTLDVYDDGSLRIDLTTSTVSRNGHEVYLTPTEQRLLFYLVHQRGRVISHEQLIYHVWGDNREKDTRSLNVYIHYLRRKIERNPREPEYLCTSWGRGYYFADHGTSVNK